MVAAEYKTNHHFVRRGSSPEVKMSECKVRLQMVNVKYNYFRLHALLPDSGCLSSYICYVYGLLITTAVQIATVECLYLLFYGYVFKYSTSFC